MNREMNNSRKEHNDLPVNHGPGIHDDCRVQTIGYHLQPLVQQTEQTALSGYFRSRIPEHDPVKGDAG